MPHPTEGTVEREVDGKKYVANWTVKKGLVTVSNFELGSKTTQVGGSPPQSLAGVMLRELIAEQPKKR